MAYITSDAQRNILVTLLKNDSIRRFESITVDGANNVLVSFVDFEDTHYQWKINPAGNPDIQYGNEAFGDWRYASDGLDTNQMKRFNEQLGNEALVSITEFVISPSHFRLTLALTNRRSKAFDVFN